METLDYRTTAFQRLARPGGGFSMVANDGRESLRGILNKAGRPCEDSDLADFKTLVAEQLAPHASAMLCDGVYGSRSMEVVAGAGGECGLIAAVDDFTEPRFGPLADTRLDHEAMNTLGSLPSVVALKFFVFWRREQSPADREADVRAFVDGCAELGVLSLLEGVVTVPVADEGFGDAVARAAEEFGRYQPDIYKTQAPDLAQRDLAALESGARRISDSLGRPWVVLSNGIPVAEFAGAVGAVCRGGASGFLAGRAAWSEATTAEDPAQELAVEGARRLREFGAAVDEYATPWWQAAVRR